jgi:hypothetical protein
MSALERHVLTTCPFSGVQMQCHQTNQHQNGYCLPRLCAAFGAGRRKHAAALLATGHELTWSTYNESSLSPVAALYCCTADPAPRTAQWVYGSIANGRTEVVVLQNIRSGRPSRATTPLSPASMICRMTCNGCLHPVEATLPLMRRPPMLGDQKQVDAGACQHCRPGCLLTR